LRQYKRRIARSFLGSVHNPVCEIPLKLKILESLLLYDLLHTAYSRFMKYSSSL
jgi:hypothetical protein